ncbi:MAG: MOSC domain-containing protein [Bdellovibrionota bacterium]
MSDVVTVVGLSTHPLKSGREIRLNEALLKPTGIAFDRCLMVVHANTGKFVSQRSHSKLATVKVEILEDQAVYRLTQNEIEAPLIIPMHSDEGNIIEVTVHQSKCSGKDQGEIAAEWFRKAIANTERDQFRLVRFTSSLENRPINSEKFGGHLAHTEYADGAPFLIANFDSLVDLGKRMAGRGREHVPMNRFRPNITITGLEAWEEDTIAELASLDGTIVFDLPKPCARCPIPTIDQETGIKTEKEADEKQPEPYETLRHFRFRDGNVWFGENAVLTAGAGLLLKLGDRLRITKRRQNPAQYGRDPRLDA